MNPEAMFGGDIDPDVAVADPLDLLDRWLARVDPAIAPGDTDSTTTPLMALATVDAEGYPCVRHVLLSSYDRGRLHFHTDTRTAKAAQLAAHPRAGATIVWPDIPRQLSVAGIVVREPESEQALAFARRTRYLQLLAWVNDADLARLSEAERASAWEAFDRGHPTLDPPPTWVGYVLVPERISFWRGGPGGPSQRIACSRTTDGWSIERRPG
jgi:pyridoxamine 5'-phosphate oxidase